MKRHLSKKTKGFSVCTRSRTIGTLQQDEFIQAYQKNPELICGKCAKEAAKRGLITLVEAPAKPEISEKIKTELLAAAEEKFDVMWSKELARMKDLFENWSADKNYLVKYFGTSLANAKPGVYNAWIKLEMSLVKMSRYGFYVYMETERAEYFEGLTAKMMEAVAKYFTGWDDVSISSIATSAKGYTISGKLMRDNQWQHFITDCISAGGYNIQCYHYRYITQMGKIMSVAN